MNRNNIYTVGRVTQYITSILESEPVLEHITVQGEVSNPKYHTSGHIYFDIKDDKAKLACVMFRGDRRGLSFQMKEGDKVLVTGRIGIYGGMSRYQLYARQIERAGEGELFLRYQKLKKELEEMGMFDASYKKPIPKYIRHLGIVTAETGAAVRDIIRISLRRDPGLHITLYPALVQGEGAASSVARGIAALDEMGVDVIIAGRGGGSIEDLWAFNEEEVARAIFSCSTPIISAVGHETDYTIADFVADKRAATPSEAAELATTDKARLISDFDGYRNEMYRCMNRRLSEAMQKADHNAERLALAHPAKRLSKQRMLLEQKQVALQNRMDNRLLALRHRLEVMAGKLDGASPVKKLAGGYSYLATDSGKNIRSVESVCKGDRVSAYVSDGMIEMTVDGVKKS